MCVGFEEYCERYSSCPNVLLCVQYVCDVGRIIVNCTEAAGQEHIEYSVSNITHIQSCTRIALMLFRKMTALVICVVKLSEKLEKSLRQHVITYLQKLF